MLLVFAALGFRRVQKFQVQRPEVRYLLRLGSVSSMQGTAEDLNTKAAKETKDKLSDLCGPWFPLCSKIPKAWHGWK
jgi:hypothetical protein